MGYSGAELSWTLEDNALINRTIEAVGGPPLQDVPDLPADD